MKMKKAGDLRLLFKNAYAQGFFDFGSLMPTMTN